MRGMMFACALDLSIREGYARPRHSLIRVRTGTDRAIQSDRTSSGSTGVNDPVDDREAVPRQNLIRVNSLVVSNAWR
jgi:hypothetical protein